MANRMRRSAGGRPMPFKASSAASPCTSAMSSVPASSRGTFSALPLVFCGLTSKVGSTAFTVAVTASPYTGKPPPGVAVPSDTTVLPDAPAANASGSIASMMPRLESTTQRIGAPLPVPVGLACVRRLSIFDPPAPGTPRSRTCLAACLALLHRLCCAGVVMAALAAARRWRRARRRRRGAQRGCADPRAAARRPLRRPQDRDDAGGRRRRSWRRSGRSGSTRATRSSTRPWSGRPSSWAGCRPWRCRCSTTSWRGRPAGPRAGTSAPPCST